MQRRKADSLRPSIITASHHTSDTMTVTRKFCYCLPTRVGVLVIAPITFCVALANSIVCFYALGRHFDSLALSQRITFAFLGCTMALIACSSVAGVLGALFKMNRMATFYASSLYFLFFASLAFGGLNFGLSWHFRETFAQECHIDNPDLSHRQCMRRFDVGLMTSFILWVFTSLLALYLVNIVRQYALQLMDERYERAEGTAEAPPATAMA